MLVYISTNVPSWSSGQDVALSRLNQGFDSPTRYHLNAWICRRTGPRVSFMGEVNIYSEKEKPQVRLILFGVMSG